MLFTARSRNSIAVTSVDHFRNGNKRPISITSLSSTSSSSSGQSANHGLLNSLNLAFEALNAGSNTATDSPHFNRRSMNSSNGKKILKISVFLVLSLCFQFQIIPLLGKPQSFKGWLFCLTVYQPFLDHRTPIF